MQRVRKGVNFQPQEVTWTSYFDVRENHSDFSYFLLAFAHAVKSKKGTKIRWYRNVRGGEGGGAL